MEPPAFQIKTLLQAGSDQNPCGAGGSGAVHQQDWDVMADDPVGVDRCCNGKKHSHIKGFGDAMIFKNSFK